MQEAVTSFNDEEVGSPGRNLQGGEHDIEVYPIFIFDGESAGTKLCGYNRMTFLLECLQDLDRQLREVGSQLFICR